MSEEELSRVIERLRERRLFDEIFVLIVERTNGDLKLLDYGMKEVGELAAWIAVQKGKRNQLTEGEKRA